MNGETILPKRLRLIFRILSVLTLLEGFVGFLIAADSIATDAINYRALQHLNGQQTHASALRLLYFLASANVVFNLVLLYAGGLLWKLKRRGLLVLIYVLAIEIFYILACATTAPSNEYGIILGFGMLPFAIQVVTAFPIVAGVLIFFAYRYLGIPARPTE